MCHVMVMHENRRRILRHELVRRAELEGSSKYILSRRKKRKMESFTRSRNGSPFPIIGVGIGAIAVLVLLGALIFYFCFRINVGAGNLAVLTHRVGTDLKNGEEFATSSSQKGILVECLTEGRHFRNPFFWDWAIYPMVEIPSGKMGIRVRLYGDDLPYGHFLARKETEKGIVEEVLPPGRYPINAQVVDGRTKKVIGINRTKGDFVEIVEIWEPVSIPAGYRGIVTNLAGPISPETNTLLVKEGFRGTQEETLTEGTFYKNPYFWRIDPIDCRSQRFNLSDGSDLNLLSKDGFRIKLDGIIEFRVIPEQAAKTFVLYNELKNDTTGVAEIDDEIVQKIVLPNARSFCRLKGANSTAVEFIGGETRSKFQKEFQIALEKTCKEQGVEIYQALVTKVVPPAPITQPLQGRELARQQLRQYKQEVGQQFEEANLAKEKGLIIQKKQLIDADSTVVEVVTKANEDQAVKLAEANRDKEVAQLRLDAAKDQAEAIMAKAKAEASVTNFANLAESAAWKKSVEALGKDGFAFADYTLRQKLAQGYKSIMVNSDKDSPLMRLFDNKGTSNQFPVTTK